MMNEHNEELTPEQETQVEVAYENQQKLIFKDSWKQLEALIRKNNLVKIKIKGQ